jgi:hypothetical protein
MEDKIINDKFEKAIVRFSHMITGRNDLDLKVENHHNKNYLVLTVDWAKVDKNSGSYDESYSNFVRDKNRKNNGGLFILSRFNCLTNVISQAKKLLDVKLEPGFSFKNYDHLDEVERKVSEAILESKYPQIEVKFYGEWDSPILKFGFYNVPMEEFKSWDDFQYYIFELEDIMNNQIDLGQYSLSKTYSRKTEYDD